MGLTESQLSALQRVKENTENTYDKNVLYIASGTLALSLAFMEKIVNLASAQWVDVLISSWIFLVITIVINLVSHQLSALYNTKVMYLYGDIIEPDEDDSEYETKRKTAEIQLKKANKKTDGYARCIVRINWMTTIFLVLGISSLVLFCSLNVKSMKNTKEVTPQAKSTGTKGANIVKPIKTTGGKK